VIGFQPSDLAQLSPFLVLTAAAVVMLLAELFHVFRLRLLFGISGTAAAWLFLLRNARPQDAAFRGMIFLDGQSLVFGSIILAALMISLLLGDKQHAAQGVTSGVEVEVLQILSAVGALVMVSTANLLMLFLGFELMSLCVYILTGLARKERASAEGALKYFILGSFSSAFLLYGVVLIYGACGSLQLAEISSRVPADNLLILTALGLFIFGFGFKVSLAPFHVWTPDVYQGAPAAITAFMAAVVKIAAFGAFARVLFGAFLPLASSWIKLLWVLSVLTMLIGNLAALRQQSVKRMLAYSSIAHAGYVAIGLVSGVQGSGYASSAFYLLVYSFMTLGAFGAVLAAQAGSDAQYDRDKIDSLAGLGWSAPFIGVVLSISLLSLAGLPPLGGFFAKFFVFRTAMESGYTGLVIIAALNSVLGLYYYLRIMVVMYFGRSHEVRTVSAPKVPAASCVGLAAAGFLVLYLGISAGHWLEVLGNTLRW